MASSNGRGTSFYYLLRLVLDCALTHSTGSSSHTASIHILDDDSLLNVFYLFRPGIFDDDDDDDDYARQMGGKAWAREKWWYKLTHVCQRWRNLILGSASYLGLCLVCTIGTPVADMLAHSPPLPLIIDHEGEIGHMEMTALEDERIALALVLRDRVRRIRLCLPAPRLNRLLKAINGEYPTLKYLIIKTLEDGHDALILPETLQAPHLHHLMLIGFAFPIGSQLFPTALGLATLGLHMPYPFHFLPTVLLLWLSSMPQLETLMIGYYKSHPVSDDEWDEVEGKLVHSMPTLTQTTLPNLRMFVFRGFSAHIEVLVPLITAPGLENLAISFYHQNTFSVPNLLQFMNRTTDFSFRYAGFYFSEGAVAVGVQSRSYEEDKMDGLLMKVECQYLDGLNWQVSSVAQIFDSLSQRFSTVEHLTLEDDVPNRPSEENNVADGSEWRKLLRSFNNVKTLRIDHRLVGELSRCLRPDGGELDLDLLPELQELTFIESGDVGDSDAFTSFIDARQNAGHPVTLILPGISELPSSSAPVMTTGRNEGGNDPDT